MDNKRLCPECGTPYPPTRSDQVYCDTTCRWSAWRKKKEKQKQKGQGQPNQINPTLHTREKPLEGVVQTDNEAVNPNLSQNLRGVIVKGQPGQQVREQPQEQKAEQSVMPIVPTPLPETAQVETQAYKDALAKKAVADAFVTRVLRIITLCEGNIGNLENDLKKLQQSVKRSRILNTDILDLDEDLFWNEVTEPVARTENQKAILNEIAALKQSRSELDKWIKKANEEAEKAAKHFSTVPRYEKRAQSSFGILPLIESLKKAQENKIQAQEQKTQQQEPINQSEEQPSPEYMEQEEINQTLIKSHSSEIEVETNEDLISNEQLAGMEFHCLDFQNKWLEFFGQPAVVFHLAVHGRSGHGKSNFCFQLANYLANNFGNTVYISGEEGFSKTLQDKKKFNRVDSKHIYWCRYKNYDSIKSNLKNQFNFIFLDSIDTLDIDAVKLREMRGLFPDSAFITISQSTKAGHMRGSNEILHDSDMAVQVQDGVAVTTKNRFKETGAEFIVFPKRKSKEEKITPLPKNII